jgi:hypothetical protein
MMQKHLRPVSQRRLSTKSYRQLTVQVRADNALIVNAKSGGHAFIGYYLAKSLKAKGHSVTILNDGEEVEKVVSNFDVDGYSSSSSRVPT